jgi:peptide/nickel transport system substrate-binding protein
MKKLRFFMVGAALTAMGVLAAAPLAAQETGSGGIIVEGNFGGDPATLNIVLASDTASQRVGSLLFPGFLAVDVTQAAIAPSSAPFARGAIVEDWTVSEDNTVYTFNLREDLTWNDGTPITSADVLYTWRVAQAAAEGVVGAQIGFITEAITNVEAPDDFTVVVTFNSPECTALSYAGSLIPLPSHVLPEDLSTLVDDPYNLAPTVTSGPFNFSQLRSGELVALTANPEYFDATDGVVLPEGWIYRVVSDQNVLVEQFFAGEVNVIDGPAVARRAEFYAAQEAGEKQVYSFPGNAWDYVGLNLADPNNPQNALDADGNPIDQGSHPIFGDVRVRQALALGIDVDSIIDAAVFGEGIRMNASYVPASWAYDEDLAPIPFDPEAAAALLEEAGWVDADGDGVREASGALHAEDGTPLRFTMYSNEGNGRREAIGTLIQDQLADIGVQVDFQTIDFNTLLDIMDSQTYDAFILGWRNGYPDDPDQTQLFSPTSDVVGGGSNNTSWNNPEWLELSEAAKNVPGCATEERAEIYNQMAEIFQQDLPYIPLFAINGLYAADDSVTGFGPYPSALYWNLDTWSLATP